MILLLALLIVIPLAELFVIVQVAHLIGLIPTLALLLGVSMLGAWLLKREGLAAWRRVRETSARGVLPTTEVADGALVLLGGALLLTPGFITDVAGLLLLVPPVRVMLRGGIRKLLWRWGRRRLWVVETAGNAVHRTYDTHVVDRESGVPVTPSLSEPPRRSIRSDAADSRDIR
ncbi:MAG: FxsA family protein [Actinomycetota bacterium]|nr:FxsA family protein [Actinomycetota bacterium]